MKKLLAIILVISLSLVAFASCGNNNDSDDTTQLRVGFMAGPTGMGMAKLISDNGGAADGNEKYAFTKFENTKLATAALTSGKSDIVCLPTNEAAAYYNSTDDNIVVLAVNTLNTLFLLTDANNSITSFSELEGKTVYTCKNGTPKTVLEYLLNKAGINATVSTSVNGTEILTPAQLGEQIIAGNVSIAVAPEPIVTSSLLKIKQAGKADISYSVDLNLDTVWSNYCDSALTMGCIVANKSFVNAHPKLISSFLKEYKASIEYISNAENADTAAKYIVETGIMAATPAAKSALNNLSGSIKYIDGDDMKTALTAFYKAIGITSPDNDFYYKK